MAEDTDQGAAVASTGGEAAGFAAESLRIRTEAQKKYAQPALARLSEIAMGPKDSTSAVQVSALRELLDQTLGRPYAPAALPVNQHEEFLAIIDRRGEELRAKLDRMAATEPSGSSAPVDQSRAG